MPTTKIILDTRTKAKGKYRIRLRIHHRNDTRHIALNIYCEKHQFNAQKMRVTGIEDSKEYNEALKKVKAKVDFYIAEHDCRDLTCQELKEKISNLLAGKQAKSMYLSEYVKILQDRFEANDKHKTASVYGNALNAVISFGGDVMLIDMDVTFFEDFKAHLNKKTKGKKVKKPLSDNTKSVYLRTLRAVLNKARKEKHLSRDFRPFEDIHITAGKSKKVSLTMNQLIAIKEANFLPNTEVWHHRNLFMFMFYCRGMNFIDMAYLSPGNIKGNYIEYTRHKTDAEFKIYLLPQIQEILSLYKPVKFIFPIMSGKFKFNSKDSLKEKDQALHVHNGWLKKIAKTLNIDVEMTSYVARHTYVAMAALRGFSPKEVSETLGHSESLTTERHYFPDTNQEILDSMNEKIVSL